MRQLIVLFVLMPVFALAQAEDENFYLNDEKLSWQKAYATDKSMEEVYTYFENSALFEKVRIENKVFYAKLKSQQTDAKKTGIPGVPPIVYKTDYKSDVMIQYRPKEKDYVVSMTDIVFVGRGDFLKKNEKKPFEEEFVRAGETKYRPGFLRKPKKVYNFYFSALFELN